MAKGSNGPFSAVISLAVWITGVLVSLAVGFAMTGDGVLNQSIPGLAGIGEGIVISIAGWAVVILTLLSAVLAILEKLK